jgi:transcriptional regulator CtsR
LSDNSQLIEQAFSNLIEDLIQVAMEDRTITEEEGRLIDSVRDQIDEFKEVTLSSMPEKLNNEKFKQIVQSTLARMITRTIDLAKKDNVISDDEIRILKHLIDFQDHYGKQEENRSNFSI